MEWIGPLLIGGVVFLGLLQLFWAHTISAIAEKTDQSELMQVLARACGHRSLSEFTLDDLTTFDPNMVNLSGVTYGGVAG